MYKSNNRVLTSITKLSFQIYIFLFISFNLQAQKNYKKNASEEDYDLWSLVESKEISENGKWYTYTVSYQGGADTLFVKSTKNQSEYFFAGNTNGLFRKDKWFCSLNNDRKELSILNLMSGNIEIIKNVVSFQFTSDGKHLIEYLTDESKNNKIVIKELDKLKSHEILNVRAYSYNEFANQLIFSVNRPDGCFVSILKIDNQLIETKIIDSGEYCYDNFVWQQNAESVVFIKSKYNFQKQIPTDSQRVVYYNNINKQMHVFQPDDPLNFDERYNITPAKISELVLSPDGKNVFFKIRNREKSSKDEKKIVQVWNASDKFLQPIKRSSDGSIERPRTALWKPENNELKILTDSLYSDLMLDTDHKVAILWNPAVNEPQANYNAARDYKTVNLKTGIQNVILKKFQYGVDKILLSPAGKYITYFKDHHWWVYNLKKNLHINLTEKLKESFSVEDSDYGGEPNPYGHPGWTPNDESILVYDKYDIWQINPENLTAAKLTQGAKEKRVSRVAAASIQEYHKYNFDGIISGVVNLNHPILIESFSIEYNELWWHQKNGNLSLILSSKNKISTPIISAKNQTIVYKEENFNLPPSLVLKEKQSKNPLRLYQSNAHYLRFNQGSSKIINYRNTKGQIIDAAVFYPSDYIPGKLYPMIVHIYSKQSEKVHDYVNPSLFSGNGFNISNYTNNGYFVMLPDIIYEYGNPGNSAADCVISATKKAVEMLPVDPKKIGLIGHSFGGYEADYIITQTNIFSAAVAGAAITDLVSSYLYVSWNYSRPNFFHYEYGQLRMGAPLFKNYLGYVVNSPIYYADRVTTPLLSWTGEDDRQVHYYQTFEFYLALRRLNKKHVMLVFPGQRHVLTNKEQQRYLNENIMKWFDNYLKK